MENNYFLHANAFSKFHLADHNDTERHWHTIIYHKDYTVLNSKTCALKRRKFPLDDQTDTNLKLRLECISRDLKLLWKVFSMYLRGNRHWVPLSCFLVTCQYSSQGGTWLAKVFCHCSALLCWVLDVGLSFTS